MIELEYIKFNDWEDAEIFADYRLQFNASYVSRVNSREYPQDSFTTGQLASKAWALTILKKQPTSIEGKVVCILGCWIGTIVEPIYEAFKPSRIWGFDSDPAAIDLAEKFNQRLVQDEWAFKGIVADINFIDLSNYVSTLGPDMIHVFPDVVINTSAEHMTDDWYQTVPDNTLNLIQTNNNPNLPGHVNTAQSIEEVIDRYPMQKVYYAGSLQFPLYTRYMLYGLK